MNSKSTEDFQINYEGDWELSLRSLSLQPLEITSSICCRPDAVIELASSDLKRNYEEIWQLIKNKILLTCLGSSSSNCFESI